MLSLVPYFENSTNLVNTLFNEVFRRLETGSEWSPVADVAETDDGYQIIMEIPGISSDDINISVEDGVLLVTGERKHETEVKEGKSYRFERSYGKFARSWKIGKSIISEEVDASYVNGLLTIVLKKRLPEQPKKIQISIG